MQGLQSIEVTFSTSRVLVGANLAGHLLAGTALLVCAVKLPWITIALLPGLCFPAAHPSLPDAVGWGGVWDP